MVDDDAKDPDTGISHVFFGHTSKSRKTKHCPVPDGKQLSFWSDVLLIKGRIGLMSYGRLWKGRWHAS